MQRDPTDFTGSPSAYGHEADGCIANGLLGGQCNYRVPVSPALDVPSGMASPQIRSPLGVFEFQPSKVCPRNYIIFDHTDNKGCIVYHPALENKLNPTNIDVFPYHGEVVCRSSGQDSGNMEEESSSFKEDTEEIDALLCSDEESDEDDVVSTGRTPDPLESGPFDSTSPPRFKKTRHFSGKSSVCHRSMENLTHEKIRKMVTVLRGIIPGGDQLDTPAVLEEAVRYLKFLKMEAKKLGVEGSK
ncbi:transcription factor bHLH144-like [Phragmites australis]|uniref:transcription factor bHLH144-like n=1 Tax=Phragmites australis TaxID=29695 RepID=UPI002D76C048|nr:transcription factor bHLH144-like [Phragmites australis]XP_062215810.1 transcription factor bHLH144-like [Phragmites australis]XP_062215819.1 transcription factor bHLH144-like [Phragmites australis]XP_062215828.1 transcription factor bHLH144-like [Phragmites australis]